MDDNSEKTYRTWRIGWRLAFMLGAAGLLAWRCREGVSFAQVGLVFILYVAAATLWVRGQYQASVDARRESNADLRPYAFPYKFSFTVLVVAAVVAFLGVKANRSTLFLCGAIVAYFALGYLLMRFRRYDERVQTLADDEGGGFKRLRRRFRAWRHRHRGRVGFALLTLSLAALALLAGLLLLENHGWAIWLAAVGFLLAPVGLAVLAEPVTRHLQGPGHTLAIVMVATVGAVVLVADILYAKGRVDTPRIAVIAFTALALLVLAIVSSTQADIAVVIAAICLMGVTNASFGKPDELTPKATDRVLVALGDSYMSGEGAKTYYTEAVDTVAGVHENHCNRAPSAWAALEGQASEYFDSVEFLACSGARTFNVQHMEDIEDPPQEIQFNEPGTQLDQYDKFVQSLVDNPDDFTPELAVISLGGNDSGFSTIGAMCLAPGDCLDKRDLWEGSLPQVQDALTATFTQVNKAFPRTPVLVTAYPNPIYTDPVTGDPVDCDQVTLSPKDMQFISDFLPQLNDRVEDAAKSQGFFFLDEMENSLRGAHLQLCDPGNNDHPGINYIGLTSVGGIAEQRFNPKNWYHNSLHPNERGHAAMLQIFQTWLEAHPDVKPGKTIRDVVTAGTDPDGDSIGGQDETTVVDTAPCDLFADDQSSTTNCRSEGAKWARGQAADKLLFKTSDDWWGLQIAIAAFGAWLLSIALFGAWKPWWGTRHSAANTTESERTVGYATDDEHNA